MTNLKESKIAKAFNSISWLYRPLVISLLIATITWGVKIGNEIANSLENRTFSSVEQRVFAEEFFKDIRSGNGHRSTWHDHISDDSVHMPKQVKDSVYPTREEFNDILKKQAEDLYYLRNDIRNNRKSSGEIKKTLDQILDKLNELDNRMNRNGY